MASDPMAVRRGGKKLPMEDVCYYQWPISGVDKVWELVFTSMEIPCIFLIELLY